MSYISNSFYNFPQNLLSLIFISQAMELTIEHIFYWVFLCAESSHFKWYNYFIKNKQNLTNILPVPNLYYNLCDLKNKKDNLHYEFLVKEIK